MAIDFYHEPNERSKVSRPTDVEYNPFTVTFDGLLGGGVATCLYIRNDDTTLWYSDISVSVVDTGIEDLTNGSKAGYEWKLKQKDIPPTEDEWMAVVPSNSLSLSDNLGSTTMADTATYLSFWVRVAIPDDQLIKTIKTIRLRIQATEATVT